MQAIVVKQDSSGGPRLVWETVPDVTMAVGEVLVDVHATAVNRADLSQARGSYPPPPGASEILGLEMSGVIAAVGADVDGWSVGDRVCALLPGGGYAEQVAVPAGMLMPLPDDWSFAQGAAIPEVWFTAFVNLFREGRLQAGETVLIHAGASGVGTAAIQLARATGATPFVTAGSEEKLQRCRDLGAAVAVNYREEDFLPLVLAATGGEGVDLILDPVGADYFMRNLQALKRLGRLVQIGTLSGGKSEVDLRLILGKRLTVVGSTLRSRPTAEKVAITRAFTAQFWPGLRRGDLRPIIDTIFPLPDAHTAHQYVADNRNVGKVIMVAR